MIDKLEELTGLTRDQLQRTFLEFSSASNGQFTFHSEKYSVIVSEHHTRHIDFETQEHLLGLLLDWGCCSFRIEGTPAAFLEEGKIIFIGLGVKLND